VLFVKIRGVVVKRFTSTTPVHLVGVLRKRVDVLGTVDLPAHSCRKSGLRFSFQVAVAYSCADLCDYAGKSVTLLDILIKHEEIWS
jgi:hypothetical protein